MATDSVSAHLSMPTRWKITQKHQFDGDTDMSKLTRSEEIKTLSKGCIEFLSLQPLNQARMLDNAWYDMKYVEKYQAPTFPEVAPGHEGVSTFLD